MIAGLAALGFSAPAYAQDADDAADQVIELVEEVEEEESDTIIVTGSRLKKDTFSSFKPLQIIDFKETREVGLLDTIQILQTNEAAAGIQIDSSFGGFVLDNGPGSETINLRGLGADRTLVLVNGRRLAPLGVEGAPTQPSINSVPSILVENADLLLEGASTIYGSDAIAGVVNVTLARDFEGFEVEGSTEIAEQGGEDFTVAARWGKNFDNGFFGIAGEYDRRDRVTIDDRDFFSDCETNVEIDENGNIRRNNVENAVSQELFNGLSANPIDVDNPCIVGGTTSRFIELSGLPFGSVFANRADVGADETVLGIPGFTDPFVFFPFDADGDRVVDNSLRQFSINGNDNTADVISPQDRYNLFAFGEFTIEGEANITPFFEVLYSNTENEADLGSFQLFPLVGADNPFNPCGTNGVDCGAGSGAPGGLFTSPSFIADFNTFQRDIDPNRDGDTRDARICATFLAQFDDDGNLIPGTGPFDNAGCTPTIFGLGNPVGPINVQPVVTIDNDRTLSDVSLEQIRLVGGFKGDIPAFNHDPDGFLNFADWSFEASAQFTRSVGKSSRIGIREDRLNLSLGNSQIEIFDDEGELVTDIGDPIAGLAPCTAQDGVVLTSDVTNGCVPVNLFAPNALEIRGSLSAAEEAFLFDSRDFDTEYFQTILNGFISGKVADLPGGDVLLSFGAEYRKDEIDSIPDDIAANGLFFGFFSDQGAVGSRDIIEGFGEISIPLVADKPFFDLLSVDAGFRVLDDEFFGSEAVYTVSGGWRPTDSLLLRGSFGTSFRAPNLGELFQLPQSGFTTVFDPCVAPANAFVADLNNIGGAPAFDPTLDTRDADVISRCLAEGLPQDLGGGAVAAFTQAEVFGEGNLDLDPETSTSLNLGASFEQPFFDSFDLTLGVNFYDIDVEDAVIQPGAQFTVNDCFTIEQDSRSFFCDRIDRGGDQLIDFIGLGFINLNEEEVRGLDFNADFFHEFTAFDKPFELSLSARANHLLERRTLFESDEGVETEDNFEGEFGFPDWTGSLRGRLAYKDFGFNWFTRYVGGQDQDEDGVDEFSNAFGLDLVVDPDTGLTDGFADTFSQTCLGPNFGDVNCRDVGFTDDYFVHNLSVTYGDRDEGFQVTLGVNNVFDRDPPEVDGSEVTSLSNVPIGAGFDVNGRTFVAQIRKSF